MNRPPVYPVSISHFFLFFGCFHHVIAFTWFIHLAYLLFSPNILLVHVGTEFIFYMNCLLIPGPLAKFTISSGSYKSSALSTWMLGKTLGIYPPCFLFLIELIYSEKSPFSISNFSMNWSSCSGFMFFWLKYIVLKLFLANIAIFLLHCWGYEIINTLYWAPSGILLKDCLGLSWSSSMSASSSSYCASSSAYTSSKYDRFATVLRLYPF